MRYFLINDRNEVIFAGQCHQEAPLDDAHKFLAGLCVSAMGEFHATGCTCKRRDALLADLAEGRDPLPCLHNETDELSATGSESVICPVVPRRSDHEVTSQQLHIGSIVHWLRQRDLAEARENGTEPQNSHATWHEPLSVPYIEAVIGRNYEYVDEREYGMLLGKLATLNWLQGHDMWDTEAYRVYDQHNSRAQSPPPVSDLDIGGGSPLPFRDSGARIWPSSSPADTDPAQARMS